MYTLVVLIGVSWAYMATVSATSPSFLQDDRVYVRDAIRHWEARIGEVGFLEAQIELVRMGEKLRPIRAHSLAHTFGAALYKTGGVEEFSLCPDVFLYGCYHDFVGVAVSEHGFDVLEDLAADCEMIPGHTPFPCKHGLGHGILGYLGYTPSALNEALAVCTKLDPYDVWSGCADGVFMEYNLREMVALENDSQGRFDPRQISDENRLTPCVSIDARYRASCVFELPLWWVHARSDLRTLRERLVSVSHYCSDAALGAHSRICFEGLGYFAAAFADLSPDNALPLCDGAPSAREHLFCLSGIVRRFQTERRPDFLSLCQRFGLLGDARTYCETYAQGRWSDVLELSVPEDL